MVHLLNDLKAQSIANKRAVTFYIVENGSAPGSSVFFTMQDLLGKWV